MKYEISADGPKTRLHIHDEFRSSDRHEFDAIMARLLSGGAREVDVDLEGLEYMDSVGLGLLITLGDRLSANNSSFQVSHPEGAVKDMLELSLFDHLFTVTH